MTQKFLFFTSSEHDDILIMRDLFLHCFWDIFSLKIRSENVHQYIQIIHQIKS